MRINGICLRIAVLVFVAMLLCGCDNVRISPEDMAEANKHAGKVTDISIIMNVETIPEQMYDYILHVDMKGFPYEKMASSLFDLTNEEVEIITEHYDMTNEAGEVIGWAKILRYEEGILGLAESGRYAWFSLDKAKSSLYKSIISSDRLSGTAYDRYFLSERFSQEGLNALPVQSVLEECNGYVESIGISRYFVDVYSIDVSELQQISNQNEMLQGKYEWGVEDECYLLMYRPYFGEKPLFSIDGENDIRILYSTEEKIIDLDTGFYFENVTSKEKVNLVTVDQALLQIESLVAELGLKGEIIEITEVELGYIAKKLQQNPEQGVGVLSPCYGIKAVLTGHDGRKHSGIFLVDAVAGYGITWQRQ